MEAPKKRDLDLSKSMEWNNEQDLENCCIDIWHEWIDEAPVEETVTEWLHPDRLYSKMKDIEVAKHHIDEIAKAIRKMLKGEI